MSPPSKPRGAAPEEEFSDQALRVSWDNLGAAMGSEPQSPSCGRHGTGWLGGSKKAAAFPWAMGLPSLRQPAQERSGESHVPVSSASLMWATLATQPGRKYSSRLVPFLASALGSIPSMGSRRPFAEDTSGQEGAVGLGPGLGTHSPPVMVTGGTG